jgi:hypothetical protein
VTVVDRRGHLFQLAVAAGVLLAGWVAAAPALLLAGAVPYLLGALWWPRGAPLLRAWEALARRRPGPAWEDDGRPARFTTALTAATLAGLAALTAYGPPSSAWAAVLGAAGGLVAEVVVGACVPCELFVLAARRGWLPLGRPLGEPGA